jgi:hypothetical protein
MANSVAKLRDFKDLLEQCQGHNEAGGKGKEQS